MTSFMSYGRLGLSGTNVSSNGRLAQRIVVGRLEGRVFHVVAGQVVDQVLDQKEGILLIFGGKMRHAGFAGMHHGATQLLKGHIFVRHRLDHVGTGDKHVTAYP